MGAAVFFSIFFFTSIAARLYPWLWYGLIVVITITFCLPLEKDINPFVIIMYGFALVAIVHQIRSKSVYILVSTLLVSFLLLVYSSMNPTFLFLMIVVAVSVYAAAYFYQNNHERIEDLEVRYQALLQTYRNMKRDSVTRDQHARQEERVSIGREIHDRVGHTLTNLLMKIEILRLRDNQAPLDELKELAQESLAETRKAVRALREDHTTGMAAIIHLIRKLEAEQYVSITFSMRQNALSVVLTPEQASVIYRAIQEALTNVMRHSNGREAEIVLEAPGLTYFRFEVTNPIDHDIEEVKEGFGLQSMRERLAQIGGQLEIRVYQQQFIVRGTLQLKEETE
ncbi:hypothetical protein GCM10026983_39400 [Gracilibacillus alcaliphilus]